MSDETDSGDDIYRDIALKLAIEAHKHRGVGLPDEDVLTTANAYFLFLKTGQTGQP